MCSQYILRFGIALLAFNSPALQVAVSNVSPPLSESSAKAIFENGNHQHRPDVVPNLVKFAPSPVQSLLHPSGAPPKLHYVDRPKFIPPIVNSPGVPDEGQIVVSINRSVPLAQATHGDITGRSSDSNFNLEERQCPYTNCCPDPRYLNENSGFPWSTMGQWQYDGGGPSGICSGTMVGPKHVLIPASCISWSATGAFEGALYFSPQYWINHITTYTVAHIALYNYETPETNPNYNFDLQSYDYVVAILTTNPNVGYLGSKAYSSSWNGQTAWFSSGYPLNIGNGNTPYAQNAFKVYDVIPCENNGELLEYSMCASPGDKGTGVFGWWSDGPYLIGTQNTADNVNNPRGPAGPNLVYLINWARGQYP